MAMLCQFSDETVRPRLCDAYPGTTTLLWRGPGGRSARAPEKFRACDATIIKAMPASMVGNRFVVLAILPGLHTSFH
jgi:hypothetical protein